MRSGLEIELDRKTKKTSGRRPPTPRGERRPPSKSATDDSKDFSKKPKIDSYLVDPASSHMLVSKIKPCMSKFTPSDG